jgi:hypothetical protein
MLKMSIFTSLNMRLSSMHEYFLKDIVFDEYQNSECLRGLAQIDLVDKMIEL